jgi:hypothetical protein
MQRAIMVCALLTVVPDVASAQTGITYRFQADTLLGRVWVAGEDARRELESGEGGTARGRVEIWKEGGARILVLNPADRTYFEERAFRERMGIHQASVEPLTVSRPFRVEAVEDVRVELKALPHGEVVSGYACRRAVLTFSYRLRLGLESGAASMPGRVEGSQDFCVMDAPGAVRLPFGHGLELTSGHAGVDGAIRERLSALKGIPVARLLKVTRWIDNGQPVSATSAVMLSDIREVAIAPDRFEVPKDYRFREPALVPPVRVDR